ncbi:protein kinase superfamily protein [Actinidia rufa]|uniref:non-specific serine/threonine protein kinase n=1 Tax=Actinidia rufa TaxID=165716 RepID=A0A7J0EKD8_9ERIC|nr:protein kinase superfamily protein [Actinidia rufa]
MSLCPLPIIISLYFFLHHLIIPVAGAIYYPLDNIAVNCGFSGNSTAADGRQWIGDNGSKYITSHAGHYTLLSNFSAALTSDALGLPSFAKEFCANVEENQRLIISFTPSQCSSTDEVYAFVNGIEVISMPTGLYHTQEGEEGAHVVGKKRHFSIDKNTALEKAFRLNVGGSSILSLQDTGMFREWSGDSNYLLESSVLPATTTSRIEYTNIPAYIAPQKVYQTSWSIVPDKQANKTFNFTWKLPVDLGFRYLLRFHFCELGYKIKERGNAGFSIFVNEEVAEAKSDIIEWSGQNGVAVYRDYVVMMEGDRMEGKRDLLIALCPHKIDNYDWNEQIDAILKGLEVFKLSNHDKNLAGVNPEPLVCASTSGKPNPRKLVFASGGNAIATVTNNFDDELVVGRGGFGKVYKAVIDSGETNVAIKRLNLKSRQGADEFWTEIEMLSNLRHTHLVSLIGYCDERSEMILVYEYMEYGTLADHLYKINTDVVSGIDEDQRSLVLWAQQCMEGTKSRQKRLMLFAEVAIKCLHRRPNGRPTMANVLVSLESALASDDTSDDQCSVSSSEEEEEEEDINVAGVVDEQIDENIQDYNSLPVASIPSTSTPVQYNENSHRQKRSKGMFNNVIQSSLTFLAKERSVLPMKLKNSSDNPDPLPLQSKAPCQLLQFTFQELKFATRNFRPDNVLGEGRFGSAFKGWIEENGTAPAKPGTGITVVVKRLTPDYRKGQREWLAEVDFLEKLHHPNLVKLIGFWIEDNQRLLVYEYMARGSLDNHLFRSCSSRRYGAPAPNRVGNGVRTRPHAPPDHRRVSSVSATRPGSFDASGGTLRVSKGNKDMLWGKKTGGLYRLEGSVQTGGATVRHGFSGISKKSGQGKQPLHRGTQSKRRVAVISPVVRTREERWSHDNSQSDVLGGAPPVGGVRRPSGGVARHLGEKVQALRCGGAGTSVGSGVAR